MRVVEKTSAAATQTPPDKAQAVLRATKVHHPHTHRVVKGCLPVDVLAVNGLAGVQTPLQLVELSKLRSLIINSKNYTHQNPSVPVRSVANKASPRGKPNG